MKHIVSVFVFATMMTLCARAQAPAQIQRPVYFACSTAGGLYDSKDRCDLHCAGGDCTPIVTIA